MKRDLDLLREILLRVEDFNKSSKLSIEGRTQEEVCYHVRLAVDHNLLVAKFVGSNVSMFIVERLTYDGHEFLAAARNDTLWNSAKEKMLSTSGVLTVEGMKIALNQVVSHLLKL